MTAVMEDFSFSERRACKLISASRTMIRYQPKQSFLNEELTAQIQEITTENPRYGYPRVHQMIIRRGYEVNHKRTQRLYTIGGFQIKTRKPKRNRNKPVGKLLTPSKANERWSMDFVHDNLADGRSIRILTMLDEATRECIHMEVDTSLSSKRVIGILDRLSHNRKLPKQIGLDQGPEFTSDAIKKWFNKKGINPWYCSPGNKNENAFIESFNGRLRDECLNMHWFKTLKEARQLIKEWRQQYNYKRPHTSLKGLTPIELAMELASG